MEYQRIFKIYKLKKSVSCYIQINIYLLYTQKEFLYWKNAFKWLDKATLKDFFSHKNFCQKVCVSKKRKSVFEGNANIKLYISNVQRKTFPKLNKKHWGMDFKK